MLSGFRQFLLRGNVIDLAVAVVIGGAFGAVVAALVKDLLTPLIAAIVGTPDFSALTFTINGSRFLIGDFVNAVLSFVLVAAAVYFAVVVPMNAIAERRNRGLAPPDPDDQDVPRVPQRSADRGAAMRLLYVAAGLSRAWPRPLATPFGCIASCCSKRVPIGRTSCCWPSSICSRPRSRCSRRSR